jgi:hypothetical protein
MWIVDMYFIVIISGLFVEFIVFMLYLFVLATVQLLNNL